MSPADVDQRIILSRQTYHRYAAMIADGILPDNDLLMMHQEVLHLNILAGEYPEKAEKLSRLANKWKELRNRLSDTMN